MSKARDLADLMSTGGILEDGALSTSEIVNVTAAPEELNLLDGATVTTDEINKLDGVTATTAELNKLAGTTATTSDFDKLSNVTASATELNYMTGATSSIQSQLDNISVTSGSLTKSFTSGESATITLAQSITPAPVVSVTKEVAQIGQSSKGAWDVNATASNYDLHNTAYATTLTPSQVAASDISQATYANKASSNLGFSLPRGLWFKPDGSVLFVLDNTNAQLVAYALSTAWDASTASYSADYTFTVGISNASSGVRPYNFWFNSTGTSLYVNHLTAVYEHTLSTAWDVTTISYVTGSNFDTSTVDGHQRGLWWKPDGTRMYTCGLNYNTVYQWNFSTAFDFSTGNQFSASGSFAVNSQATSPRDVQLNSTGTKMFVTDDNTDNVYEYDLSTAWDITTATYNNKSFSFTSQDTGPQSIHFGNNNLYMVGDSSGKVHQYNFSSDGLVLGTGSFASTDVGKRIQGNGGDVILTSTAGAYDTTGGSAFTDTSTIASGSWTMHGLKSAGDADGLTISGIVGSAYDFANATLTSTGSINANQGNNISISPDGTKAVFSLAGGASNTTARFSSYSMSTPYDVSTLTLIGTAQVPMASTSSFVNDSIALAFNPEGTYAIGVSDESHKIGRYTFATAWDITTASAGFEYDPGSSYNFASVAWNGDGSKAILFDVNSAVFYSVNATNYVFSGSTNGFAAVRNLPDLGISGVYAYAIQFNSDGTKFYVCNNRDVYEITLSTAYDLTSNTGATQLYNHGNSYLNGFAIASDGSYFIHGQSNQTTINSYRLQDLTVPTSSYHLAVTNSGGQIDSAYWTDINSMTADQSLGNGEAYYAVSTDDRTTWSVAKGSDGVRPIVRDNAGTWQYNTAVGLNGYDLSAGSYDSVSLSISSNETDLTDGVMGDSGTKLYVIGSVNDTVYQYNLSTANDLSTATYANKSFSVASQTNDGRDIQFKTDGTKMYILDRAGFGTIYQYSLSTAWDVSTASYDSVAVSFGSDSVTDCFTFKPDGTKGFVCGTIFASNVYQREMTTPWDLSTLQTGQNFNIDTQVSDPTSIEFNNDGTKMFIFDQTSRAIYEYDLSTAYDITTASYNSVSLSTTQDLTPKGGMISSDGSKIYMVGNQNDTVYQYTISTASYTTSTTWANATTNDEFYALQQALGATSVNRMDKTQLDAVADGSHFTLGNTLDLMIALKQDTASASLPTSDGVTINYDAEALNQGAVLGTDYDFDFPANNKVRITSNAAQNLKIRVV